MAFTCPNRQHTGWLSPRSSCEQMSEQRPQRSYPPPQWLVEPTLNDRIEARAALSSVVPASAVAAFAYAAPTNSGQKIALKCSVHHHIAG